MTIMVGMSESTNAGEVARRIGIPVAGAGIGLIIGDPVIGALAGAAAEPLLEIALERRTVGLRKVALLWRVIEDLTGLTPHDVAAWAKQREDRLDVTCMIVQAAFDTRSERKVRALARVLANGLGADAHLEYGGLIVAALRDLEEPHIRVLHAMVADAPPPSGLAGAIAGGAWCRSQLQTHLPGLARGIGAIAAALVRVGMITEGLAADPDSEGENLAWMMLPFGVDCHEYLAEVSENAKATNGVA